MTSDTRADGLTGLGWYLDRRRIRDAFITVEAAGISVAVIDGAASVATLRFSHRRLARLARLARRCWPAPYPPAAHPAREELLRLAGQSLAARGCYTAFIVLYDDLVIVDDDSHGPAGGPSRSPAGSRPVATAGRALSAAPATG